VNVSGEMKTTIRLRLIPSRRTFRRRQTPSGETRPLGLSDLSAASSVRRRPRAREKCRVAGRDRRSRKRCRGAVGALPVSSDKSQKDQRIISRRGVGLHSCRRIARRVTPTARRSDERRLQLGDRSSGGLTENRVESSDEAVRYTDVALPFSSVFSSPVPPPTVHDANARPFPPLSQRRTFLSLSKFHDGTSAELSLGQRSCYEQCLGRQDESGGARKGDHCCV
jgi:hypothetical protein